MPIIDVINKRDIRSSQVAEAVPVGDIPIPQFKRAKSEPDTFLLPSRKRQAEDR